MEIETHFETRKEYVIVGNELASLEEKHKKDKEEAEKKKKELEELMAAMISNVNNVSSSSERINSVYIPKKRNIKKTKLKEDKFDPSKFNSQKNIVNPIDVTSSVNPLNEKKSLKSKTIGSNITGTINNGNSFKNNNI